MSARVCTGNKRCPTQTSERLRPAMISCKFQAQQARCGVCVCVCCVLCVCDLSISLSLSIYLSIYLSIPLSISISLSLYIYIYIYYTYVYVGSRAHACARALAHVSLKHGKDSPCCQAVLPGQHPRPNGTGTRPLRSCQPSAVAAPDAECHITLVATRPTPHVCIASSLRVLRRVAVVILVAPRLLLFYLAPLWLLPGFFLALPCL